MQILIPASQIEHRVTDMARRIAADYQGKDLTVVGVLTGSIVLLTDLIRRMDLPCRVALVQASSYRGKTTDPGELHVEAELLPDLRDRHVLLVDDILDTGHTLHRLREHIQGLGVASLRIGVLLWKKERTRDPVKPDYYGFEIPNKFVVGYGLDYNDEYRHLPYIAVLEEDDLARKPGAT